MDIVKKQIDSIISSDLVEKERIKRKGKDYQACSMNMIFGGNPGSAKTTVAKLFAGIAKEKGILKSGAFVERGGMDLDGLGCVTAIREAFLAAKGGVLFIDEAYSITENDHSDSYGRECLTELTKALEDYRDDLVVIVAGYTEPMKLFFDSNPGLKSRFNTFIEFDDYSSDELISILETISDKNAYRIDDELRMSLKDYFAFEISKKQEHFANGRLARNIYDDLVLNHARRVNAIEQPTDEELLVLFSCDFKGMISIDENCVC